MLCNHFSKSLIFSGDFATTFCSKIGNVLEMLSRYVPSFSNRCPYFCELPILSRYLRLPRYPIGIVDYGDMYQILNYAVLLIYIYVIYHKNLYAIFFGIPNYYNSSMHMLSKRVIFWFYIQFKVHSRSYLKVMKRNS